MKNWIQGSVFANSVPIVLALTLEPPGVALYLKQPAGKFYPRTFQLFLYG